MVSLQKLWVGSAARDVTGLEARDTSSTSVHAWEPALVSIHSWSNLRSRSLRLAVAREPASVQLPPEIGFLLVEGVPYATLDRAAALARKSGTDAATALLNNGLIAEEMFYRALARNLGTPFLDGSIPLAEGSRYPEAIAKGAAPICAHAGHLVVAAPRGHAIARLIEASAAMAVLPAITTPSRLQQAVFAHHARAIAEVASDGLMRAHPTWSCRPGAQPIDLALAGLALLLCLLLARQPNGIGLCLLAATQIAILAMLCVRIAALAVPAPLDPEDPCRLGDDALPVYTIFVALYREARVVPRLIHSLSKLDYPAAKLDIKFLLEADDTETAAAFAAAPMPARFEVVVVPDGLPRTKPRALNAALPLARGDLLVVYDAEDVPDPGQLRAAATLFAKAPATTAAIQGRLVIDNFADGWLQRFFAIEYTALFDVLGPALARWRMPTPLGGTTTHFRTRVLRELHGWDSWNVTEDADLGMRMALAGYQVGDLPSATFEEAPEKLKVWIKQRTRWMKGFLQTSFTHGRRPLATLRRLGPVQGLFAVTLLPGTVASALCYPFLTLAFLCDCAFGNLSLEGGPLAAMTEHGARLVFVGGVVAMLVPGALGCIRRGWWELLPWVLLLPLFFLLVSFAAWLAVFELARHPHRWNKTEHGLSRTSRSGALHLRRRPEAAISVAFDHNRSRASAA